MVAKLTQVLVSRPFIRGFRPESHSVRSAKFVHIYRPQILRQGNVFTRVCHSVHRGACMRIPCHTRAPCLTHLLPHTPAPLGMHAPYHACLPCHARLPPPMPSCHVHPLPCMPPRYYEMLSMSGRYASYLNAFLLLNKIEQKFFN